MTLTFILSKPVVLLGFNKKNAFLNCFLVIEFSAKIVEIHGRYESKLLLEGCVLEAKFEPIL